MARRQASGSPSATRADHCDHLAERQRLRGRSQRGLNPIKAYWQDPSQANRKALRAFLTPETTRWQYTHGVPDPTMVSPDGQNLDNFYLARPGADEVQLDLFGDYKSNVALYPTFQKYFRTHKPPLLAVWGKNDPFFVPAGAEAFRRYSFTLFLILRTTSITDRAVVCYQIHYGRSFCVQEDDRCRPLLHSCGQPIDPC